MWFKKNKWKIIVPIVIVAILAGAFWYGGGAPGLQGWSVNKTDKTPAPTGEDTDKPTETGKPDKEDNVVSDVNDNNDNEAQPDETDKSEIKENTDKENTEQSGGVESRPGGVSGNMSAYEKIDVAEEIAGENSPGVEEGDKDYSQSQGMVIDPETGKDKYLTDPVPEGKPLPVEPQDATISDKALSCTISISCSTILEHMAWLDPEKVELVPEDGWILEPTTVTFYEGESVFNVLLRTCKQNKIHMEFENTPIYNSAYIEGINNLYEFDCGQLSGWMYKVNEWFPNYGCSRYQLKDGDVICWVFTCDLGVDVGGYYSVG